MLASLALASVVYVFYPTAPPRLVDGLGITDTVGLSGHDTGSFAGIHFNPYAAMPSMREHELQRTPLEDAETR